MPEAEQILQLLRAADAKEFFFHVICPGPTITFAIFPVRRRRQNPFYICISFCQMHIFLTFEMRIFSSSKSTCFFFYQKHMLPWPLARPAFFFPYPEDRRLRYTLKLEISIGFSQVPTLTVKEPQKEPQTSIFDR